MASLKPRSTWIAAGLLALCAAGLYAVSAAPSLTLAHGGVDGGELAVAVDRLGIPHPTGYPSYVLIAQAARLLPWRSLAGRLNLFSALAAALTVGLVARVGTLLLAEEERRPPVLAAALAAGSSLAVAGLFWSQAIIAEVYALNALFLALATWLYLRWRRGSRWALPLAGLCLGVGLGNHVSLLFLLPGLALALLLRSRQPDRRPLLAAAGLLLLGLGVYLYLPLRAAADPWLNWGNPDQATALWAHVSGQSYRSYLFRLPWTQIGARLSALVALLWRDFGPWGLPLGLAGLLLLGRRDRAGLLLIATPAGLSLLLAVTYGGADSQAYLLPLYLAWALGFGVAAGALAGLAEERLGRSGAAAALLLPLVGAVALAAWHWPTWNLRHDPGPLPAMEEALAPLPERSLLLTHADEETFPLWYLQAVEGEAVEVAVIDLRLLAWPWYREQLPRRYPGLVVLQGSEATSSAERLAELLAANPGRPAFALSGLPLPAGYRLRREGALYRVVPP